MRRPERRIGRELFCLLGLLSIFLTMPGTVAAQSPGLAPVAAESTETATDPLESPEAVRELVSRLSDSEVRALLLERLDAAAQDEEPDRIFALGNVLGQAVGGFSDAIGWAFEVAPNLLSGIGEALHRFYEPRGTDGTLTFLGILVLSLIAGWVASLAAGRLCARFLPPPPPAPTPEPQAVSPAHPTQAEVADELPPVDDGPDADDWPSEPAQPAPRPLISPELLARGQSLLLRLAVSFAQAAAFLLGCAAVISVLADPAPAGGRPSDNLILTFFLSLPVLYVVAMRAVSLALLAPGDSTKRVVPMEDHPARILHTGLIVFAGLSGVRLFALSFLGGHGLNLADLRLGFWLSLALYGWLMLVAWRAREGLTHALIGQVGEVTVSERRLAELYPYLSMVLIAVFWALSETFVGLRQWAFLDGRLPLTLLILIFAPAADRVIRALVYSVAPPIEGEGEQAEHAFAETRRSYIRVGRVVLAFLVLVILSRVWDFSFSDMASAGIGQRFAGSVLEAASILGFGYVVLEVVRIRINSLLAREKGPVVEDEEPGGGEGGGSGGSRLSTVLPLISWALQAAIVVITILTALGTLGIDTTPLLAGAGIVGLAVGFGAQTLVADIVSGIFFLIDDAFRVGEYVEVEGTVGTVEKISVRSLRLRHHEGPVHTIPFGQIPKLTNYSRDWVIMKLRFTVPFETDLMKVKKLFKQIGKDMMANPDLAQDFLQPFKSQGVLEVNDVGMVLRGKFMAKPGRQWTLRKEIYQRVQRAFEDNGIQFARKEVRVKIDADPASLSEEQRQAVAAAASDAAEKAEGQTAGGEPR